MTDPRSSNIDSPRRFRKKPVVIEAVQWDGSWATAQFVTCDFSIDDDSRSLHIPTLEGEMEARVGDWIIRGVQGEFYPCKPDIFAATYEEVES